MKGYKNKAEFRKLDPRGYSAAMRVPKLKEALLEIFGENVSKVNAREISESFLISLVKSGVTTRKVLIKDHIRTYHYLKRMNRALLDKYFPSSLSNFSKEEVLDSVKNFKGNNFEWRTSNPHMYDFAVRNKLLEEINCILKKHISSSVVNKKHTKAHVFRIAKMCSTLKEFRIKYRGEYCEAQRQGWLKSFKLKKLIEHGKVDIKYISKVAKNFNNKTDFARQEPGAYEKAKKLGIFNEITKHMNNKLHKPVKREDGVIFQSAVDASKFINRAKSCVSKAILGGWKAGGYHWAYCDKNGKIIP